MRGVLRRLGDLLLTIGAVLGVGCLVLLLAGLIVDLRPLIFRSGSMGPEIPAGSLALARTVPVGEVAVGDVVSVPAKGSRVTHRVVEIVPGEAGVGLRLRGDANRTPDAEIYRVDQVDRVLFSVPVLGSVIGWLSRPPGVFVLALYVAVLLALIMRRPGDRSAPPRRGRPADDQGDHDHEAADHHRNDHGRRTAGRVMSVVPGPGGRRSRAARAAFGAALLGGTASLGGTPTWAAFTDNAPVSGTTISTGTVPAPTLNCGLLGVLSVRLNWTAVADATNYTLYYGNNGSSSVTTTNTTYTITTAISGGTAWVVANRNFGSTTWTSARSNTRSYTVAVVSLCA